MADAPVVACRHCATLHERVPIEPGAVAMCRRCGYALFRNSMISPDGWIALTATALIVFAIANYFPIARLNIQGMSIQASLPGALYLTWQEGHRVLAIMTGLFGFWLPLTQLFVLLWALMAVRARRLPADFRHGMRLLRHVEPWSMVPVLMLGILVAIVKFAGLATIQPEPAIWAFALLAFLITALSRLTAHRLWRHAEDAGLVPNAAIDPSAGGPVASCESCGFVQSLPSASSPVPCERCGARIHFRKPDSFSRVWALVIAASIIYIPANVLPVMRVRTATSDGAHTILGGVIELWRLGSWDLAVIVFIASVVVPMTKLLALMVLMVKHHWRGSVVQRQRTRLYELIEFIGQWSMLDVFVVILMTAMANFPGISQVIAGPGAASFGVVVILTMLATMSYDPRCGWDRRAGRRANPPGHRLKRNA
ncbi:paraquat-inducible protein A [Pollutimonas sp. M17]|uniref:paraquat-inducible protein A n=1 Tax=Pollutimonas sp. M17 TaxID=2962065 RepID=UPI0021F44CAB|nr:paraquat-inducible protein A [Pollutimonas sp. M17]UYO95162.1 paraquat-inducible protein A [Pollutimonas sp. M17]HWK70513.1 paraquat-inducible protein A [Burkholderiaceae bacterium]